MKLLFGVFSIVFLLSNVTPARADTAFGGSTEIPVDDSQPCKFTGREIDPPTGLICPAKSDECPTCDGKAVKTNCPKRKGGSLGGGFVIGVCCVSSSDGDNSQKSEICSPIYDSKGKLRGIDCNPDGFHVCRQTGQTR